MGAFLSVNKKFVKKAGIITVIFIFIMITCIGLYFWLFNSSKIAPNVFIHNINVGGLTPGEARSKVNEGLKKQSDEFVIQLIHNDNIWDLTYEDVDLCYLLDSSIEKAYRLGKEGNYFYKIKIILNLRKEPKIIKLVSNYSLSKIEDKIDEISKTIDKSPVSAKIERKNGTFIIAKETLGMEVDKKILERSILSAVNDFNSILINIEVKSTKPKITKEDLGSIKDLIGKSVTAFNSQDKGRTENIKIATDIINGTVLMPGEEFSFNDSTGQRDVGAGYKEASVIMDGEFTVGIGGGVCQVSTTLYQAALRSDMEITSRRNHGLPVGYVPMGQDATVAYGYIDLKFRNNKESPVYIEGFVTNEEIHIKLYGKKIDNTHIDLNSEVLEVIEPKMQIKKDESMYLSERKVGKSGKKGYRVATYKIYLQGEQEIKRELISRDYYPPRDGIILEGMKR